MRYRGRGEHSIKELEDIIAELKEPKVSESPSVPGYVRLAMEISCTYDDVVAASEEAKRPLERLVLLGIAKRIQKAHRMANALST